ncbi:Modifier of mdg4, partial [Operophtera brumata]
ALSASSGKGDLHFIQTKSGHLQLIHEPYIFVTDSVRSGRTFWRCMDYAKRCRARITSKNNVLKVTNAVHNHVENHLQKITRKYELGEGRSVRVAYSDGAFFAVEFVISNRGRRHMRLGGFSFYMEKVFPEKSKVRWRCTRRTCRAYAHTLHDRIFALSNVHSHEPPSAQAQRALCQAAFAAQSVQAKNLVRLSVGPGGRPRLWVRGRSFYAAHTMRSGIVRWRCTMGGCGCKAYTQKGTLHKLVGEHNHIGRCGRRAAKPPSKPCPTPLLVPRLPTLDFHNFDPNAWVVPLPY